MYRSTKAPFTFVLQSILVQPTHAIDDTNFSDNLIPGIPSQMLDLDIVFNLTRGRSIIISNRLIGERYADNENETLVSSYNLLNLKYSKEILSNSEIFIGANNNHTSGGNNCGMD